MIHVGVIFRNEAKVSWKGPSARLAVPTPDHYWPLMYVLGAAEPGEAVTIFNDRCIFGSVSMTSVAIGI